MELSTKETSYGCLDLKKRTYAYNSSIYFYKNEKHYIFTCVSAGMYYQWEISLIKDSLYTNLVNEDNLGCKDKYGRYYPENYKITEDIKYKNFQQNFSYICKNNNGKHYFIVN